LPFFNKSLHTFLGILRGGQPCHHFAVKGLGKKKILEMLLSGDMVDAKEAERLACRTGEMSWPKTERCILQLLGFPVA
jgi:hypothetical protein